MEKEIENLIFDLEELTLDSQVYMNNQYNQTPIGQTGGPSEIKPEPHQNFEPVNSSKHLRNQLTTAKNSTKPTQGTWNEQFIPKIREEKPIPPNGMYLNIDCELNTKEVLLNWGMSMQYFFVYFGSGEENTVKTDMLTSAFTGNVRNWWYGLTEATKLLIKNTVLNSFEQSIEDGVDTMVKYIFSEFLGEDPIRNLALARKNEKIQARLNLEKLSICKMCYINEYTCEYQKYYYEYFDSSETLEYLKDLYYMKLPVPWNNYFLDEYQKYSLQGGIPDSLGSRIKFLKERIEQLCYQRQILMKSRKAEIALCCEKTNMPTQWGCQIYKEKRYKRKKHYKPYRKIKKYKRFKKEKVKPRRRYFKRKIKKTNTNNRKPNSQCECWNCGDIGHISYDCPKKKVKILYKDYKDIESELSEMDIDDLDSIESDIYEIKSDFSSEEENE
jgi:Zinc knuckle